MDEVSTTPTPNSGATPFESVTANDVYAQLAGGGSVEVSEFPGGDLVAVAKRLDGLDCKTIVLEMHRDVDGTPGSTVHFHSDEMDRLADLEHAIGVLIAARDALLACGYVDYSARQAGAA